jgi:drug/metabolite transporter (DMT)-like permease
VARSPMTHAVADPKPDKAPTWEGMAYLAVVYVVWGSTYLAIRIAVREGSGFPPITMAAMRLTVAGLLMLTWGRLSGRSLRVNWSDLRVLAGSGVLLWGIANGLVVWAEQRVDSGLAALTVGAVPIWSAVIDAALDRRRPSWALMLALLVGLSGLGVLVAPVFLTGIRADLLSVIALLVATLSWASGSVLQGRRQVSVSPIVSSGYQQIIGGLWLVMGVLVLREPAPHPTGEAWAAWTYLVVVGGLGFTAYVQALRLLPISLATTYAYVNPVIAVFLGWLILGEPITVWTLAGAGLVIAGVAGVLRLRLRRGSSALAH